MVAKKKAKAKKAVASTKGKTAFIAIVREYDNADWRLCQDIHKTAEKARACGCAEYGDDDNVRVLEVVIVQEHKKVSAYSVDTATKLKFND